MLNFFLECAIRAALIVGGTALVLRLLRVRVASVKHRVWLAVRLLMLALPLWTAWGPKAELRLLPASVERFASPPTAPPVIPAVGTAQPAAAPRQIAGPRQRLFTTGEEILLGIYLVGMLTLLARLTIGTIKAHRLIRDSANLSSAGVSPALCLSAAEELRIRISHACAAPVTVGCFRPTILLPENWHGWSESQLSVVLAHEREHVRRRDPLVQWLALFNRAIFWFHPAAWWLERELSALAEESCDAAVLAQGHDPHDYAEILMSIARDVTNSGSRINSMAVAMPGPRLPQRIRCIIGGHSFARISRLRAACAIATCVVLSTALLGVTLARAQDAMADWEKAAGKMSFDVASVKQNLSYTSRPPRAVEVDASNAFFPKGGLFSAKNEPLTTYIGYAYKLTTTQLESLVPQMPQWALKENFDVEARGPAATTQDQARLMLQSLLADRFKLAIHFETRQLPVFALVLEKPGKTGPQLRSRPEGQSCDPAPGSETLSLANDDPGLGSVRCGNWMIHMEPDHEHAVARDVGMAYLAGNVLPALTGIGGQSLERSIVDRTGLTGEFDVTVDFWRQTGASTAGESQPPIQGPTILEALKDQLGLKLEPAVGPVDVLVIDHIEEPSPN